MKGYKGFDKDLKCKGFQYEVGGEYEEPEVNICKKGFHFCENPMDVLRYYPPNDSRYAEVEGDGKIETDIADSKICCSKLRIKTEIGLSGLIQAGVKFILDKVDWKNAATNTGNRSAATNTGNFSAATNTGICSVATNTGDRSIATNTGYYNVTIVKGQESVAISLGVDGKAKGALGCWLVLAEWKQLKGDWHRTDVKCGLVDGNTILPDTYYMLQDGKFVEVEAEGWEEDGGEKNG